MRAFVCAVGTEGAFSAGGMEAEFAVFICAAEALVRMSGWSGEVGGTGGRTMVTISRHA